MGEREVLLAEAHKRCPFVTMGQYFNTWFCGLVEQFGWKCESFCSLQQGDCKCNPVTKIEGQIRSLKNDLKLAERLLIEAQGGKALEETPFEVREDIGETLGQVVAQMETEEEKC